MFIKRIFTTLLAFFIVAFLSACPDSFGLLDKVGEDDIDKIDEVDVEVEDIVLEGLSFLENEISLDINSTQEYRQDVLYYPSDTTQKELQWSSDNPAVAEINNLGKIIVKSLGDTVIRATSLSDSSIFAEYTIHIVELPLPVEEIRIFAENEPDTLSGESITMMITVDNPTPTRQLHTIVLPENATDKNVEWSTDDSSIATISQDGLLTVLSAGETVVRVESTSSRSIQSSFNLNVQEVEPDWNLYLAYDYDFIFNVIFKSDSLPTRQMSVSTNAPSGTPLGYFMEDNDIAIVSDTGMITGIEEGLTVLHVYFKNYPDIESTRKINVRKPDAEDISYPIEIISATVGYLIDNPIIYTPSWASKLGLIYRSTDEELATVDRYGNIMPHKAGMVTIEAGYYNWPQSMLVDGRFNVRIYDDYSQYQLGGVGPTGGLIFYDDEADGVDDIENARFLELSPKEYETSKIFCSLATVNQSSWPRFGGTYTQVGTGETNTERLVYLDSRVQLNFPAAVYCDELSVGGVNDWYLPSIDELQEIYLTLYTDHPQEFNTDTSYWSSSEHSDLEENLYMYAFYFSSNGIWNGMKSRSYYVRPIRSF